MIKRIMTAAVTLVMTMTVANAQNPVVQTWFTSDPAPMVNGDRIYMYVGHDEDNADFFWMYEWRVYSSSDMVNWTDHGSPIDLSSFQWADDRAWASQTIERDGKFYWYFCAHSNISKGIDGQAWIFWGNPVVYYAKLNRDMISFDGEVKTVNQTVEGFGAPNAAERNRETKYKDCYVEGPWIMKRNVFLTDKKGKKAKKPTGIYYLLYAAGGIPEHIAYSTAPSPEGPWTYRGNIMPQEDTKSFTNHCGVADFKGHSYFFYHTGKLPGGGGFGRSAAVEEFTYQEDGLFPIIHHTDEGVAPIGTLNPYQRIEAETMAWSVGLKSETNDKTGVYISEINNGDYIKVREVDFGEQSPKTFTASVASALQGGKIEVRLDSIEGQQVAVLDVPRTGGWEQWQVLKTDITEDVTGGVGCFLQTEHSNNLIIILKKIKRERQYTFYCLFLFIFAS